MEPPAIEAMAAPVEDNPTMSAHTITKRTSDGILCDWVTNKRASQSITYLHL